MLEKIYTCPKTIFALRVGPLGAHLDEFIPILEDRGYALGNIRSRYGILAALSWWLISERFALRDLNQDQIDRFIAFRKTQVDCLGDTGGYSTLSQFFTFLRDRGAIPVELKPVRETEIQIHVREYAEYLTKDRGLASTSIKHYCELTEKFLENACPDEKLDLGIISPELVAIFVTQFARKYCKNRAALLVTALRAYFRYLKFKNLVQTDLARCVPASSRRGGGVPSSYLNASEVQRLLKRCDLNSPEGKRDYAILLLLARYGLRGCEIVRLSLGDIDWERSELEIRGKGRRISRFPLTDEVGAALAEYIQKGRPRHKSTAVFLCSRAPFRRLGGTGTVSALVRAALKRAKLNPQDQGAHLLRHTVATHALRQGATLDDVRELLRHRNINTTMIYAKVDFDRLAPLAQAWPSSQASQKGGAK